MEYREPSRMRRFEFVRPTGRLDVRRLLAAFLLLVSVAVVVVYIGRQSLDSSVSWLHRQPRYQVRFDQIQLAAPPPDCFRGGATAFLERVRRTANEPETLSTLDLEPGRIERAFKLFPWVENVEGVQFPPGSIVVQLAYNEPAAVVRVATGDQVVLDRHGRLLPLEDIDTGRIGRTIQISGKGVIAPPANRLGLVWKTETPERPELAAIDRYVLQAAKLAGFLLEPDRKREAESSPALRVLGIVTSSSPNEHWLYIQKADDVVILWGDAPGDERPGDPTAEEKWKTLVDKTGKNALDPQKKSGYWTFTHNDMRFVVPSAPRS